MTFCYRWCFLSTFHIVSIVQIQTERLALDIGVIFCVYIFMQLELCWHDGSNRCNYHLSHIMGIEAHHRLSKASGINSGTDGRQ